MIIEQIRYFVDAETLDAILEARRQVSELRRQLNLPPGRILIADPPPDDGPALIWQCAYEDEGLMGAAEAALIGNAAYEDARGRLVNLAGRVEIELYMADDDPEEES
jgi:hypothetical protein